MTIVAGAALLGFAHTEARAASEPVVHLYDVQVTGVLRARLSLPSKPLPLDFGYSEVSTWTETYKGVRLEVLTSEFDPDRIELRMEGKSTITGSITYGLSGPRIKSCTWSTKRSEPGSLLLLGTPYTSSAPGAVRYRLHLSTGRHTARLRLRPSNCPYFEGKWARFTGARVGPGGGMATGWVDTRSVLLLALEFRTPQQPGQLGFPLNRLHAGAGFVLALKGKTKDQTGRKTSEGTARIRFVPRPS